MIYQREANSIARHKRLLKVLEEIAAAGVFLTFFGVLLFLGVSHG